MIAGVRGTLEATGLDWAVVQIGGLSVRLSVPTSALAELGAPGDVVRLHTHLAVREDALTLYGFPTPEALHLFEMLIGVTGVGPRLALALLSALSPHVLAGAIAAEDTAALAQVTGVGARTAGRIVLDLKGKMEREWVMAPAPSGGGAEELTGALLALGYTPSEVRQTVAALPRTPDLTVEEQLRLALQRLASP